MIIKNTKGKVVNFTDGSRLDMKSITENNDILTIESIATDKVIMTYDESFQMNCFGLDGDNQRVLSSMDTLRRSINLYGQIVPIIVSVIDENAKSEEQKYQIIDGLKRFYIAMNDQEKEIKAMVIHKEIKSAKSIVRLLSNQQVVRSPENIIDEARTVRSQTDDIRESFIEQVYDLDYGSLEYLNNALIQSYEDPNVHRIINRYRNGSLTIKEMVRKLDAIHSKNAKNDNDELSNNIHASIDSDHHVSSDAGSLNANQKIKEMKEKGELPKFNDKNNDFEDDHFEDNFKAKKTKKKKAKSEPKERTVADAENLLRSKQNRQKQPSMKVNDLKENKDDRQFVGDRHPLPKSVRLAVLDRDDYTCQVCGRGGRTQPSLVSQFQLHHMIDVQLGGRDEKDNLILLCEQCHALITKHKSFPYKPIPEWVSQYDPTTEELDENPNMWTIMVLSKIEQEGYKEVINQISNTDSRVGKDVRHYKLTIGQAVKKLKNRLVVKHKINAYDAFQQGVINLYQEKAKYGFTIPNQKIREKAIEIYQKNHKNDHE